MEWPPVSVVIITKGNHADAVEAVRTVLEADYPPDRREILVLEETDQPQPIEGTRYETIPMEHRGFGYARSEAVKRASHDLLAFIDDDCRVEPDWLKEILRPLLEDPAVDGVGGAVLVRNCGAVGRCENILGFPGGGVRYVEAARGHVIGRETFSTCNAAVRRSSLEAVGGFDPAHRSGGEDMMVSSKMKEIRFNPDAVLYHDPRDSVGQVFRWFLRRGRGIREVSGVASIGRSIVQSILLRFGLAATVLALIPVPFLPSFLSVIALWYLIVFWKYRYGHRYHRSWKVQLLLPVVKAVMDVGTDLGTLVGWILPRRNRA